VGKYPSYIGQMFTYLKTLLRSAPILVILAIFTLSFGGQSGAKNEQAGDFDYYVMALSWSPSWCRALFCMGFGHNTKQAGRLIAAHPNATPAARKLAIWPTSWVLRGLHGISGKNTDAARGCPRQIDLPPSVIEDAFLEANKQLLPDMVTITCKSGALQEARICLTKSLELRRCGRDVIRDCQREYIDFFPIK